MKQSCQQFIDRLDDFLEGRQAPVEREVAEEHLRDCARCRELAEMIGPALRDSAAISAPEGIAESILRRTSGSPCQSAGERICDLVDGRLQEIDEELVRGHLDGCDDCSALARTVARLAVDLPALAEPLLDERLVEAILARTSAKSGAAMAGPGRLDRWVAGLLEGWRRLVHRPRLAWEGAYLATIMLAVLFAAPGSPLSAVPGQFVELLRQHGLPGLGRSLDEIDHGISGGVHTAWEFSGEKAVGAIREVPGGIDQISSNAKEKIEKGLGTISRLPASKPPDDENGREGDDANRPRGE